MNIGRLGWCFSLGLLAGMSAPLPLRAQQWNDAEARALIDRAIMARRQAEPDTSLLSYRTRAHGFVFFLAQAGESLEGTPRLIKADELDVEVYWHAPATSKQRILGWRDGRWLPTDINYHRDHLGIVTNNFGDLIRLGDGDEVRDVPHPLAEDGPARYDYRVRDSVTLQNRHGVMRVIEVEVRPRDPAASAVIGTLSLEAATGAMVRFRFSFTPASYRQPSLEDISVVLENAQVDQRWWLPWRQEIEIRRRTSWFNFPARSIIRGRWEIGDYELNVQVPPAVLRGPSIGGLRAPSPDTAGWAAPLAAEITGAGRPVEQQDLDRVRTEVARIAVGRVQSGSNELRPGVPALSDLVRVNRVQGLALGMGLGLTPSPRISLGLQAGFGTSDERLTGTARLGWKRGNTGLVLTGGRALRDLADQPLLSPIVNSLLAQEGGRDQGDYVLVDRAAVRLTQRLATAPARQVAVEVGWERSHSVAAAATPARGSYRPNPALGVGDVAVARIGVEEHRASLGRDRLTGWALQGEGGTGAREYLRLTGRLELLRPAGPGGLLLRLEGGAGTRALPPYRSFAIGGWGTLPGTPFRGEGGRRVALAHLEYQLPVAFPAIPLGSFVSTGRQLIVAPFVAAGTTGGALPGVPWQPTHRIAPVAGLAFEWLQRLIRVEAGMSLRTGRVGVTVDVAREWWGIL